MPGVFDDLIPSSSAPTGAFDDLVPKDSGIDAKTRRSIASLFAPVPDVPDADFSASSKPVKIDEDGERRNEIRRRLERLKYQPTDDADAEAVARMDVVRETDGKSRALTANERRRELLEAEREDLPPSPTTSAAFRSELDERSGQFGKGLLQIVPSTLKTVGALTGGAEPEKAPIYRAGKGAERALASAFPEPENPDFGHSIVRGAGQVAATVGSGAVVRGLGAGMRAAQAVAIGQGSLMEFDDAFDRARERGDSADKALAKALGYAAVSALIENRLGAGRLLRNMFPSATDAARELTARGVSKEIIKNFIAGGAEEGSQRFAQNWIVDEKPSLEGVGEEAAAGSIIQGIAGLPSAGVGRRSRAEQYAPTDVPSPTVGQQVADEFNRAKAVERGESEPPPIAPPPEPPQPKRTPKQSVGARALVSMGVEPEVADAVVMASGGQIADETREDYRTRLTNLHDQLGFKNKRSVFFDEQAWIEAIRAQGMTPEEGGAELAKAREQYQQKLGEIEQGNREALARMKTPPVITPATDELTALRQNPNLTPAQQKRRLELEVRSAVAPEAQQQATAKPSQKGLSEIIATSEKDVSAQVGELMRLWPDITERTARRVVLGSPFSESLQKKFETLPETQRKRIDAWFSKTDKTADELIGNNDIAKAAGSVSEAAKSSDEELAYELVRLLRSVTQFENSPIRPHLTEIMGMAAQEAKKRGSSADSLRYSVQKEMVKVFGNDAPEMMEYYFGRTQPAPPAPLTPDQRAKLADNLRGSNLFTKADMDGLDAHIKRVLGATAPTWSQMVQSGDLKVEQQGDQFRVEVPPLNPGGAESALPSAQQEQSRRNNSIQAFAEANGIPYVAGDTPEAVLAKIKEKTSQKPKEASQPTTNISTPESSKPKTVVSPRGADASLVGEQTARPISQPTTPVVKETVTPESPAKLNKGDAVTSAKYGKGKVIADMGNRVRVDFGDGNKFAVDRNDLSVTPTVTEQPKGGDSNVRQTQEGQKEEAVTISPADLTAVQPLVVQAQPIAGGGGKYRIGTSPQTFSIVERLPQSETERENNEQPVRVRNDQTGKEQTVLESDLTAVQSREPVAKDVREWTVKVDTLFAKGATKTVKAKTKQAAEKAARKMNGVLRVHNGSARAVAETKPEVKPVATPSQDSSISKSTDETQNQQNTDNEGDRGNAIASPEEDAAGGVEVQPGMGRTPKVDAEGITTAQDKALIPPALSLESEPESGQGQESGQPSNNLPRTSDAEAMEALRRSNVFGELSGKLQLVDEASPEGRAKIAQAIPPEARTAIERVFGRRIVFFDASNTNLPAANGVSLSNLPGFIFVNINSSRAHLAVIGHELGERIAQDNPEIFRELLSKIEPLFADLMPRWVQIRLAYVRNNLAAPEYEDAQRETLNDFIGDNFTKPEFWNRLAEKEPSLFRRLADAVVKFLDQVMAKLRRFGADEYFTDVEQARELVSDALVKFAKSSPQETQDGEARLSLESDRVAEQEQKRLDREMYGDEMPNAQQAGVKDAGTARPTEHLDPILQQIRDKIINSQEKLTPDLVAKAWQLHSDLTDNSKNLARLQELRNTVGGDAMLALLQDEIGRIALKQALETGDQSLLVAYFADSEDFLTTIGGKTAAARTLRAAREMTGDPTWTWLLEAYTTERLNAAKEGVKIGRDEFLALVKALRKLSLSEADIATQLEAEPEPATGKPGKPRAAKKLPKPAQSDLAKKLLANPRRANVDPAWRREQAQEWLEENGYSAEEAAEIADDFSKVFEETWAKAAEREAERVLGKKNPQLQEMIRLGILDPEGQWIDRLAAKNGWKKPTREEFQQLMDLDAELDNPDLSVQEQHAVRERQYQVIRRIGKRSGQFAQLLAESFAASLLSGPRTVVVQFGVYVSALRDLITYSAFDPKNSINLFRAMVNSAKANLKSNFKYSWQNNVTLFYEKELENNFKELERLHDDVMRTFKEGTTTQKAVAAAKWIYAQQRFVIRLLNTMDSTSAAFLREWKLAYYSSVVLRDAKLTYQQTSELLDAIEMARRDEAERWLNQGLNPTQAQLRANRQVDLTIRRFMADKSIPPDEVAKIFKSAENDYYRTLGRRSPGHQEKDEGSPWFSNFPFIGPNRIVSAAAKERAEGGWPAIVAQNLVGFVSIPWRSTRANSSFGQYGLFRYGVNAYRKAKGKETYWKQSFATSLQERARLRESIAGTILWAGATGLALAATTAGDGAGDEDLALYITGDGPENKVLRDAWLKRGFRPNSLNFVISGRVATSPLTRINEAVMYPFIFAAAIDDAQWKRKADRAAGKPERPLLEEATSGLIGQHVSMMGQRGLLQTASQITQMTQQEGSLKKGVARYAAGTASGIGVPFKQALASISEMTYGPLDYSSASSMVANAFPIIGLPWQQRATNRFGDPMYDQTWYGKVSRLGVPIAFQVARSADNERLYPMLVDKGVAPPELRRSAVEEKFGSMTDEKFAQYVERNGTLLKRTVLNNLSDLRNQKPETVKKFLNSAAQQAEKLTALGMGLTPQVEARRERFDQAIERASAPIRVSDIVDRERSRSGYSVGRGRSRLSRGFSTRSRSRRRYASIRVPKLSMRSRLRRRTRTRRSRRFVTA